MTLVNNIHNLIFVLFIKIVRRVQADAKFKSEDTLEQGALALYLFTLGYIIFSILFPIMVFGFTTSKNRMFYIIMSAFLISVVYTNVKFLRKEKWKKIEESIDTSLPKTRRDRIFGILGMVLFVYYSITLTAFIAFVSCR